MSPFITGIFQISQKNRGVEIDIERNMKLTV